MSTAALVQLGNPFFHSVGSIRKSHPHRSDTFNQHQLCYPLGKCARVEKRDRPTHGMANERKAVDTVRLNDAIEIEDIIGKMVVTARTEPAAVALAAAAEWSHA